MGEEEVVKSLFCGFRVVGGKLAVFVFLVSVLFAVLGLAGGRLRFRRVGGKFSFGRFVLLTIVGFWVWGRGFRYRFLSFRWKSGLVGLRERVCGGSGVLSW